MSVQSESVALRHNSVGTFEVAALSFSGLAPTMAMALGTSFAALEAGSAAPLSYLLAMVGSLALGYVFVVFARRIAASGVAFTYLGAVFGKTVGFVAGWIYAGGWLFATSVVLAISSDSISALLAEAHANVSWFPIFVILTIIVLVLNILGVNLSLRTQLTLELVSVATLFLVMLAVVIHGGASGNSWAPFSPSSSPKGWGGIGFGMIYGFSAFAGFEAGTALGLESKNPTRTIPVAVIGSLVISAVFYVFVTYALSIGYGVNHAAAWANDPVPLDTITKRYVSAGMASVVDAMVAVSAFSAGMGVITLSTRVFYAIARMGLAPAAVMRTHPKYKSPYVAILLGGLFSFALGAGLGLTAGPGVLIGVMAGATTLGFIAIYAGIAVAAMWAFGRRAGSLSTSVIRFGIPIVAVVLLAFAFYASVIPQPPFPYSLSPLLVVLWALVGVFLAWLQRNRGQAPSLDSSAFEAGIEAQPGSVAT